MPKKLTLTGLGNEIDLNTGETIFTAIFDNRLRVPISKEGAEVLTKELFTEEAAPSSTSDHPEEPPPTEKRPVARSFEDAGTTSPFEIDDVPASVHDDADETGVSQV